MVQSLSQHELISFTTTIILILLVILRLALPSFCSSYEHTITGTGTLEPWPRDGGKRRARRVEKESLLKYTVDAEEDETDGLLPAFTERS